jgi:vesicle-fusing ATPase
VAVPAVNSFPELASVLREVKAFDSEAEIAESLNEIRSTTRSEEVGVGIKDVLFSVATAKQSDDRVGRFAEEITNMMAMNAI